METDVGVFACHSLSDMGVRSPHVEILIQNVNKRRSQLSVWDSEVKKRKLGVFIQMKKCVQVKHNYWITCSIFLS